MNFVALFLTSTVSAAGTGLPNEFAVPSKYYKAETFYAAGTQNYACDGSEWKLSSANAQMWSNENMGGDAEATHYFLETPDSNGGRPTWESLVDGSKVTVKLLRKSPDADSANIAWLQTLRTAGSGAGTFEGVEMVLRVHTGEGIAPKGECGANATVSVDYTSQYWFYKEETKEDYTGVVSSASKVALSITSALATMLCLLK